MCHAPTEGRLNLQLGCFNLRVTYTNRYYDYGISRNFGIYNTEDPVSFRELIESRKIKSVIDTSLVVDAELEKRL